MYLGLKAEKYVEDVNLVVTCIWMTFMYEKWILTSKNAEKGSEIEEGNRMMGQWKREIRRDYFCKSRKKNISRSDKRPQPLKAVNR